VSGLLVPFLAFQVWDAFGWGGQALFTWRVVEQWVHSERARRTVIPPSFWLTSLAGSLLRIVYDVHRGDPVFLSSDLVSGCLYARNLWMSRTPSSPRAAHQAIWPLALALLLFLGCVAQAIYSERDLLRFDANLPWLLAGFVGSVLWAGRFIVQWYASERLGRNVLPVSFFWMSLAGSVLLCLYAVFRPQPDWVNIFAFALNPIPYGRNLVLIYRHRREGRPDDGGTTPALGPPPEPEPEARPSPPSAP
jgi:lipid-A-disaccharide synthase-like uncharacterized protein